MIVEMLRSEANQIGAQINPFDPALRRPNHFLARAAGSSWVEAGGRAQPALMKSMNALSGAGTRRRPE